MIASKRSRKCSKKILKNELEFPGLSHLKQENVDKSLLTSEVSA
jgi:hypothetical protein